MFQAWVPEFFRSVRMPEGAPDLNRRAADVPSYPEDLEWERALAVRIQQGDSHAFALLVDRYLDRLTRFAMAMVDSRDAAEDVVQHVFVWLWESRATLDPARPFKPYLYRAVRNRVLNERDATHVRARYQTLVTSEISSGARPSAVASPEGAILSAEELEYALHQLPERRAAAVRLRYEAQLSYEEIGDAVGISTQAATQLVLRGVEQLRILLRV